MPHKDHKEYNAYLAQYMLRRYHERKAEARQLLGGRCVECGATEELEFDHVDPSLKSFTITQMWSVSRERYLEELAKCQLLCKEHHLQKTLLGPVGQVDRPPDF